MLNSCTLRFKYSKMSFSSNHQVILYLNRNKRYIFLGGILSVFIYFLTVFISPRTYQSGAIIYNTGSTNKGNGSRNEQVVQDLNDGYTIINWVYSTELVDHLISKFNLYDHYGIDTISKDAYAKCFNAVSNNVAVSITPYNAVKITVKDKDRILASRIANEILNQVDDLNEQMVIARKKQVVHEYDVLLDELSREVNSQRDSIKILAASLSRLKTTSGNYSVKIEGIVNSLTQTSLGYEKLAGEWLNVRKSYLLSLKYIEKYNLPSFVIIQHALPEIPENPYSLANFGFALIVFIGGGWIVVFLLIAIVKYSNYAKTVFKNINSENPDGDNLRVIPIDYLEHDQKRTDEGIRSGSENEIKNS